MTFQEMLRERFEKGAHLCVGLDPTKDDTRTHWWNLSGWLIEIVDATAPYAAAFKPNLQFYLGMGTSGLETLARVIYHVKMHHPTIPIILDAKWGDIGKTNLGCVEFANNLGVHAVTVHNYMGYQAMLPLLEKFFCFVLCRTSNPGADEFQNLTVLDGQGESHPLYSYIAQGVANNWKDFGPGVGLVVGATNPVELADIDKAVEGLPFLIPGVGTQGGTVADVMKNVYRNEPLINVSSGVMHANNPDVAAHLFNEQILTGRLSA